MLALDELMLRHAGLARGELLRWVENRWVLPEPQGGTWIFTEVDVARVELILEIRRDLAVDDEALSLVLGLLDQIYGLRRQLSRLCEAIASQPADVRAAIEKALPRVPEAPAPDET
jgi:chaperone modulatory protein CbpM